MDLSKSKDWRVHLKKKTKKKQARFKNIKTIIKCGKVQLVSRSWTESKNETIFFYRISAVMLPTLIQRYDKKIILFLIQFKNARLTEF